MKFKFLLILATLLFFSDINSQTIYFIKYKDYVDKADIEEKVTNQQFLPSNVSYRLAANEYKVDHLAKGIIKQDEILGRIIKVTFKDDFDETTFLNFQYDDSSIEYIQKSTTYQVNFTPNDSLLSQQWALEKIKAFDAWDITMGEDTIIIGVIDTGIDYLHPDLQNKIYYNSNEMGMTQPGDPCWNGFPEDKRFNNCDDDGNGFIDDYMGWDFTDRVGFPFDSSGGDYLGWDNDPMDENSFSHGTAVAGIIGAEANNTMGIAGAGPNLKILNLRAFDPAGYGEEDDVAAAILYAVQMGAKVINMSFGDNSFSFVLRDVIRYAYAQNVVMVASSGNSNSVNPHYPSGYSEVISVGNSTSDDFVAVGSNYGSTLDLVAPGTQIVTTIRNGSYTLSFNGTSAAAPHASAAAGLILSRNNFTNEEVKQIIKSTADDIGQPGWDIRSGAGRLNIFRAVSVLAPSVIKFNHPLMDFATFEDSIPVYASVLSAYFQSYELYLGTGLLPGQWTTLISSGQNQFSNQNIFTISTTQLPDSVYTLRLVVHLTTGSTLEERVNFHIIRTPPVTELVTFGPAFYGLKKTILAAVYTNQPSIVRMYYRKQGQSEFNFVSLDGFTTNNQFVSQLHYGFIPVHLVDDNSIYEIYFESENLVGLKTIINNDGSNFFFTTAHDIQIASEITLPYSLPPGRLFKDPVNFLTQDFNEILYSQFYPSPDLYFNLVKLNGNNLERIDSVKNQIPRSVGDFNSNGKINLLSSIQRTGYIDEQVSANTFQLNRNFGDSTGSFWPVLAQDIDGDGVTEIVVVDSDTSVTVWKVTADLQVANPIKLNNFTDKSFGFNIINSPNAVIADTDNDGIKELWMVDRDGDIYSYLINGPGNYQQHRVLNTGFLGSSAYLTAGDYTGDGVQELAVLLRSIRQLDIAPFYRLIVFNFKNNQLNIIYDEPFVDASTEFTSAFQVSDNSLRFADINSDSKDELILFIFPYAYIFKYESGNNVLISYKENINTTSIFVGDLNKNGVPEVAFPSTDGIRFYEFAVSNVAAAPYSLQGFSLDSTKIRITWSGSGDRFILYKGTEINNLNPFDSTTTNSYEDVEVENNKSYYYAVRAYDNSKPEPYSDLSGIIEVYSHEPAKVISVANNSSKSLVVTFSERIRTTIDNLQAFEVVNFGFPNSISPANQFAYLISFNSDLPVGTNTLLIKELSDHYGSPVSQQSFDFNVLPVITSDEFFVTSFQIINSSRIRINFNLDVDDNTVWNVQNYLFEPQNSVSSVEIDNANKNIIYLNLDKTKPVGSIGREYRLRVVNVRSSMQTGGIEINSGAGSYIILSSFASDLSDVYVYPNPASVTKGEGKVTFANLPKRARINVFSLSGDYIIEIEENDGNGGVDYNLTNRNGEKIGSGIYIYRIIMLDDANNEVEEKIGKFAVIK